MQRWTENELEFIKKNFGKKTLKEISNDLKRNRVVVAKKIKEIGLFAVKKWTDDDVKYLKENFSNTYTKEIAEKLNKTISSIENKADSLGLKKDKKFISSHIAKRNKMANRDLNREKIKEIAKKYFFRSEFQQKDPSAYVSAGKMGILDEVCSHMTPLNYSTPEMILKTIISEVYKKDIRFNSRKIIPPYELDIYLPDLKIGIEYDGKGWHSSKKIFEKTSFNDEKKRKVSTKTRDKNF